jgi:hypothetical protein
MIISINHIPSSLERTLGGSAMENPPPTLEKARAKSGLEYPLCDSPRGGLPGALLIPFMPLPEIPNGVPGTDLLGIAGRLAIESAIPGEDLRPSMASRSWDGSSPRRVWAMGEVEARPPPGCPNWGHSEVLADVSNGRWPKTRGGVCERGARSRAAEAAEIFCMTSV